MSKSDIIGLIIAYIGVGIQFWWGFWSNAIYGMPFIHPLEFVFSFGGLL